MLNSTSLGIESGVICVIGVKDATVASVINMFLL